jgi:hypothetical protein
MCFSIVTALNNVHVPSPLLLALVVGLKSMGYGLINNLNHGISLGMEGSGEM